jgi:3-isopropylmalate/(R)-2-methylmalate dehydratase small subunit
MSSNLKFEGRAWVIAGADGRLIHDIDTDQIFHNSHLAVTNLEEMGQFAFGNLKGWEDFPKKVSQGDIIVVGKNFGCGSSRQQAVDCFRALGVRAIAAISYGAIYRRNAINSGLRILALPGMDEECPVRSEDEIELDLAAGTLRDLTLKTTIRGNPASKVELDIYDAGSLFAYGRRLADEPTTRPL